ncbi:SRPBCC domain-containing protein [Fulvivirgaceae bacterium BMA12]|uniref:SRPBCC domain-containing protein n=1 Tax=Agaribacillus aureus TaxID=3051825 RepID=A0ABT8KYQ2_9BACT|nr:SRPBCC domain-containing protein [Fulvivirgaceae bacterium BMA12]
MKDVIKKEYQYSHKINSVWNAISDPDEISAWFIKADFKPEVGYKYTFTHEQTTINGEVIEANPVHKLVYTWIVVGTGVETTVSWQLQENEQGTLLTLEHSGISNYPTEDMAAIMFTNFSGGWDACITNLDKFLKESTHAS